MTIKEFDEKDFSIDELYEFCCEASDWAPFDELLTQDAINEEINELILDYVRDNDWTDVRDTLNDISISDGSWFVRDDYGYFSYTCIDDDNYYIDDIKQAVREILVADDYFDEEEEKEEWFDSDEEPDFALLMA